MLMRTLAGTALILALLGTTARAQEPIDLYPQAAMGYAVAVDDQLVWARGLDTPRAPASLTKLLSALVILEQHWDPNETVKVSARAATVEGSRIGLKAGDRVRAGDLLTGMIVRSGNDSCMAMAEHVGGSVDNFVRLMNDKAQQIGMVDSHFRNPCGLDADGHVSTPRDLLTLARVAADQPEIAQRANAQRAEFRTLAGRRIRIRNTNAILGREPDVRGLKTGFTNHAGKCLIALAERGAHKVWIVLLHSPNRWFTASDLMSQGLALAERTATTPLKQ
jgi:D-alanyl-D-alanine carboxypeptidase (penicillin-binding protein 5/6)